MNKKNTNFIYRKLIKQGNSAFTITLPIEWVTSKNLQGGDIIAIKIENDELIISSTLNKYEKSIQCDVSSLNRPQLFQYVIGLYLRGYDIIEIIHNDSKTILDIEKEFSTMILETHTSNKSIFVSVDSQSQQLELISKILYHLKYLGENFNSYNLSEFKIQEKILDKLVLLQIRNYNKYSNLKKEYQNILLCYIVDSIVDLLTEIKEYSSGNTVNKNLDLIELYVPLYVDLLLKKEYLELILELRKFRDSINKDRFEDGILFALADLMYNFIGFLE